MKYIIAIIVIIVFALLFFTRNFDVAVANSDTAPVNVTHSVSENGN